MDLTTEEFAETYLTLRAPEDEEIAEGIVDTVVTSGAVDWSSKVIVKD
jgi:hypothetical protein